MGSGHIIPMAHVYGRRRQSFIKSNNTEIVLNILNATPSILALKS